MRALIKIANSTQLRTRNLSIGRNYLSEIPADTMAAAVVRLETVSLVDGDLTKLQVETILDKILSTNPDELVLTQLDIREFNISSVSQEMVKRVGEIVTLKTGMSHNNYDQYSPSDSGSDSDSDSVGVADLSLTQLIDAYHIP